MDFYQIMTKLVLNTAGYIVYQKRLLHNYTGFVFSMTGFVLEILEMYFGVLEVDNPLKITGDCR